MKYFRKLYYKIRLYLATHKKLSIFLSHGGLHITVLLLLIILIFIMTFEIVQYSQKVIHIFNAELVDDCDNYELNSLRLNIKPKSRCSNDIDCNYLFVIGGHFHKRAPYMKKLHLCDSSLSNLPIMFPSSNNWGMQRSLMNSEFTYMWTSKFINDIANNYQLDSLNNILILPQNCVTKESVINYIDQRTTYLLDSLDNKDHSRFSPITEREFLKYTSIF